MVNILPFNQVIEPLRMISLLTISKWGLNGPLGNYKNACKHRSTFGHDNRIWAAAGMCTLFNICTLPAALLFSVSHYMSVTPVKSMNLVLVRMRNG